MLKLYAWTLTDYHRVVHLDMDSLVLQNMDELFSLSASLVYTCDYNMMGRKRKDGVCAVQGGFVIVRPSYEIFDGMVNVVKEGNFIQGRASEWVGGWVCVCTRARACVCVRARV